MITDGARVRRPVATNGNLHTLLDGLPHDPKELAEEREPEDLERLARQAGIAHRIVGNLRDKIEDAIDDIRTLARAAARLHRRRDRARLIRRSI